MTDVLKDVVERGTGRNARVAGIELAGKTGTTNNSIDAWFCGYSPEIEVIVWFGRDDNRRIAARGATGGGLAAPAFSYYFRELLKVYPEMKRTFDIPQGVYRGTYEGKSEIYTKHSPLPTVKPKDEYGFGETNASDEGTYGGVSPLEETDMVEVIDYDEAGSDDMDFAETIKIDGEEKREEDDPLHPKRKVPKTPVSEDSGTLF